MIWHLLDLGEYGFFPVLESWYLSPLFSFYKGFGPFCKQKYAMTFGLFEVRGNIDVIF